MKKFVFAVVMLGICGGIQVAEAKKITYAEEMYAMGTVSGQGLACKSQKYHQFELLARAIMVGKATDAKMQKEGMERYTSGKVDAFMAMEDNNFADCATIREEFDKQKIFDSVLYSDGRIKMYDGTLITPRKPYKASSLYEKDREAFIKADAAYKKFVAEAQARGQSSEKIPLSDSSYEHYSKEFQ
ncbi:MAG: hypothetical protein J6039_04225 [Alphaproteobacteria bacterium]|nr:hypothetical protein [Alphaproteobacteria bacterium]